MNHSPRHTVLQNLRRQSQETAADFVRRSQKVGLAKRLLPAAGLLLLAALVAAPELRSGPEANRVAYHIDPCAAAHARLANCWAPNIMARTSKGSPIPSPPIAAVELGPNNVTLAAPMGDITLKSGAWLMMKAANGVYRPNSGTLELTGGVTLVPQ